MTRLLSHSEVAKALTCQAQWDFAYGGRLAGAALERRRLAERLSAGRAWGACMAAWHKAATDPQMQIAPEMQAETALLRSLAADAVGQHEAGVHDVDQHADMATHLLEVFEHYRSSTQPMPLETPEREFDVPIPSRGGKRRSTVYRLLAYVDGVTRYEPSGRAWLAEFKLRGSLSPVKIVIRSRQIRYYAWAFREETGLDVGGVLVDERLDDAPQPARLVQAKRKGEGIDGMTVSHAKDQRTTPHLYEQACKRYGVDPVPEVVAALAGRVWHQRVPVIFRPGELAEAGEELVSAARLIRALDSGVQYPIRNAKRQTCSWCEFDPICDDPMSSAVDDDFVRVPAKRDRPPEHRHHEPPAAREREGAAA